MLISSQANPSFKHDIDAILNYAEVIGKEAFNNRGIIDEVASVSIQRFGTDILVVLDDDYGTGLEFPVEYLSLTLDEIRAKEEIKERERQEQERIREEEQQNILIKGISNDIKYWNSCIEKSKQRYEELVGSKYLE